MQNNVKTGYGKNFIFDQIKLYFDEKPIFKFGKYYGEVDMTGKVLFTIQCDDLNRLGEEYFSICINDKWGIIDNNKEWLIKPEYDSIDITYDTFYIVSKNGKYGIININNDVITDFIYDSMECVSYSKKYYAASKDGKMGIINLYGREITPFIFKEIDLFPKDYGTARFNGKYGLITDEGNTIEIDIESLEKHLQI